jgi:serine/threonine protein kinase
MLAETLTGHRPFQGEIAPDVTRAVLRDPYHLPFTSPDAKAIDEVLQRCIAKNAGERYSSASDLRAELIPCLRACDQTQFF